MNKDQIAELRALLAQATNAPWILGQGREDGTAQVYAPNLGPMRVIVPVAETEPANGAVIVALRNAAEGLLAATEERDEAVALLVAAINAVQPDSRACVSERCTLEFLRHGPKEVELMRGSIERDRDANREGMIRLQSEVVRGREELEKLRACLYDVGPHGMRCLLCGTGWAGLAVEHHRTNCPLVPMKGPE